MPIGVDERAVAQDALELRGEFVCVRVSDAGFADRFQVFRRGKRQDAVAVAHRFKERRMRAADFRCMDVAVGVLLQRAIGVAEDETGEDDAPVAPRIGAQTFDVLFGVRRIADDDQLV